MTWPLWMDRETLARALCVAPGAVDQYVARGVIPQPRKIGDAMRWRWEDVDNWLKGARDAQLSHAHSDPFEQGLERAHANGQAAPARASRQGAR